MIKSNSEIIKTALMSYYRFKRQWICATEVHCGINGEIADVMVDTGTEIREVEIKCSKSDLWQGEAKKSKHNWYLSGHKNIPNAFYICVPTELLEEAQKWVIEKNPKYGIIEFITNRLNSQWLIWEQLVLQNKKAKAISANYSALLKKKIVYRMCSELITTNQNIQKELIFKLKQEEKDLADLKHLNQIQAEQLNNLVKECMEI
jgi:hypothetical protein